MQEREAKLQVDPELVIPDLTAIRPGATLGPTQTREHVDRYFDTDDLRLARWGCTVRHRSTEGWTVKLPIAKTASELRRDEINIDGDGDEVAPPARALALLAPLLRGEAVGQVASLQVRRTARTVRSDDGSALLELCDDVVTATLPDGSTATFREIEAELDGGTDKDLRRAVKLLEAAGARAEVAMPKLVRVLGEAAAAAADVVPAESAAHPTAADVLTVSFARSTRRLLLELPHAAVGADTEGVHQARVATRRLRAELRAFGPLFDPSAAEALRSELSWLADELGAVRDADVMLERFTELGRQHPELPTDEAATVLAAIRRRRDDNHQQLGRHLAGERAVRLYDRLVDAAADLPLAASADGPARELVAPLTRATMARLRKQAATLDHRPSAEQRHRVRIVAKRARYAIDATEVVFGPKSAKLSAALGDLQDVLGDDNDRTVALQWLAALARGLDPQAAFTAGRMAQRLVDDASDPSHWRGQFRRAVELSQQPWFAGR